MQDKDIDQIVRAVVAELGRTQAGVPATEKVAPALNPAALASFKTVGSAGVAPVGGQAAPISSSPAPSSPASSGATLSATPFSGPGGDAGSLSDIGERAYKKQCGVKSAHKPEVLGELLKTTEARIAVGKKGVRPPLTAYLRFLADHARSKGTVFKEVPQDWLDKNNLWSIRTQATDKNIYLTRPDLGRLLAPETVAELKKRYPTPAQVQIVLSDGLSTDALLHNYEEILPPLVNGLKNSGFSVGEPFFMHYGRVKAEDVIGEALGCDVVVLLIGERPGLGQSESMSCYAVYRPTAQTIESDHTVISNIHQGGIPPVEGAAVIVDLVRDMLKHKASGIELARKVGDA